MPEPYLIPKEKVLNRIQLEIACAAVRKKNKNNTQQSYRSCVIFV